MITKRVLRSLAVGAAIQLPVVYLAYTGHLPKFLDWILTITLFMGYVLGGILGIGPEQSGAEQQQSGRQEHRLSL
jgi:hypothetical protein